ncbi:Gamma-glutamyltranspeptidase 3 [Exaiptasia diaphana]|nr:Gamma-glutamyltranspeptidase 3 [Exaiptasia diaphana]
MKPSEGLLVGVPGELRGFEKAWKKFGKLSWKELFEPAAKICKDGFKVHPALATAIAKNFVNISSSEGLRLGSTFSLVSSRKSSNFCPFIPTKIAEWITNNVGEIESVTVTFSLPR